MKRQKRLERLVDKAILASFSENRLIGSQVVKFVAGFKKLPLSEALYSLSYYLKGLKRELNKRTVLIETATPLSLGEAQKIATKFGYKDTPVQTRINPEVLGGLRVIVGDHIYDYSIKGKVNQVKEAIYA